jgi:5-methylcytosine-specific restriction endonuclease McrA
MHYQRFIKNGSTDKVQRTPPAPRHGTSNGYNRFGCRCEPCRRAATRLRQQDRARFPNRERATRQQYEADNKAAIAARRREDRSANPDKYRQRSAAYAQENREQRRLSRLRRRAVEASTDKRAVTVRDWLRLCSRHAWRCAYCGESAELTREHIIPLSRGGRHSIGNLLPVCGPCNFSKGSRLLVEWRLFQRVTNQGKAA